MKESLRESISKREKVEEYERLKKEYADLERDEKSLKDYLNVNVFDYAQNRQKIEDIFSIKNSSMTFLDQTKDCPRINPNIPVLEINNLTKYYASRKVPSLINVTIKVYLGDLHVVVGSNGSGKTTLFNCLNGQEDYDGDILFDGTELKSHPEFEVQKIVGFVPSEAGWDLYATVEDVIVDKFSEYNKTDIEAHNYIRSSLEQLNISYLRHFPTIELNLLEKKKIQIILALINDPHLIVFDEVFLGLQQHECLDLMIIFSKLRSDNRALLAFSYSFNDFFKFANTVSLISEGKLFYTGLVENLFLTQQNKYSITTLGDPQETLDVLEKVKCEYSYNSVVGTTYVKFGGKLDLLDFQRECAKKGIIIHEMKPMETNLQDLYPILLKEGNKEAIKSINTLSFFVPD